MLQPDQENQKNLLLAIVLSVAVLLAWQFFYAGPRLKEEQERQARMRQEQIRPGAGAARRAQGGRARCARPAAGRGDRTGGHGAARPARRRWRPARACAIDTPSVKGSISLKGGRIDDVVLAKYRETVDPKSANVVLFSPSGSPHPYYAEYGWIAGRRRRPSRCPATTRCGRRRRAAADAQLAGDAGLGQRAGAGLPAHHLGRCQLSVHRLRRGGEQDRQGGFALPLRADLAPRHAEDRGLLHPARGLDRRDGRIRPAGDRLRRRAQGRRRQDLQADERRLARLHRQVLGRGADPQPDRAFEARFSGVKATGVSKDYLPDRLLGRPRHHRARSQADLHRPPVRRRQGGQSDRRLRRPAVGAPLRADGRLGLLLFHHQAALQTAALAGPVLRQLRPRHPRPSPCSSSSCSSRSPTRATS